jgi:hypothetical protein
MLEGLRSIELFDLPFPEGVINICKIDPDLPNCYPMIVVPAEDGFQGDFTASFHGRFVVAAPIGLTVIFCDSVFCLFKNVF